MADVFLSYKREERPQVERLAHALRGLGLDVWFDASLSAGEAFSDEIDREVRGARIVLVCWSPSAAASRWVKSEAKVGFDKDNLISTYVAGPDGFEPPVPFNSLHVEDMRVWALRPSARDAAWLSVLRRVGALAGRADIAEWAALGPSASAAQIESWLATHGGVSPLVLDAESFLREREAVDRERLAEESAARERVERLRVEKAAAEEAAREARERAAAEQRAKDAEARAKVAERRAGATRRALVFGGGLALAGAGTAAGVYTWFGFYGERPVFRGTFPSVSRSPGAGVSISSGHRFSGHESNVRSATFSVDGTQIVTTSSDETARVWEVASGRQLAELRGHQGWVESAQFSPNGAQIVTASADGTTRVWDSRSWAQTAVIEGHVDGLKFTSDGQLVIVSGGRLRLIDADFRATEIARTNVEKIHDFFLGADRLRIVGFSQTFRGGPESRHALSIWEATSDATSTWRQTAWLRGHEDWVRTATFSIDGSRIVSASDDNTARVWHADTGREVSVLAGHDNRVEQAAFSPNGVNVVTASWDNTARVWNAETGREQATLRGHRRRVWHAVFDAAASQIVTASEDDTARVWQVTWS